jgi:hypothetical protein
MQQVERAPGSPRVLEEDPRPWLEIRRTLRWRERQRERKCTWRSELIGVLLVLLTSIPAAWWVSSEFPVNLHGVSATLLALAPPRQHPEHRIIGYTGDSARVSGANS